MSILLIPAWTSFLIYQAQKEYPGGMMLLLCRSHYESSLLDSCSFIDKSPSHK